MTSRDLVSYLRENKLFDGDPRQFLLYLAAHLHEMRLEGGQRILDLSDFTALLIEIARAAKPMTTFAPVIPMKRPQSDKTCPRCGHAHEAGKECGADCGGGRICHCVAEVMV